MIRFRERLGLPVALALLTLLVVVWAGTEMMTQYARQQQQERNRLLAEFVATLFDNDLDGFHRGVRITASSLDWPSDVGQVGPTLRDVLDAYRAAQQVAWLSRRGGFDSISREGMGDGFAAQQLLDGMQSTHFGYSGGQFIIRHAVKQGDLFVVISAELAKSYWLPEFANRDFNIQFLPVAAQVGDELAGNVVMRILPLRVVASMKNPTGFRPDVWVLSPAIMFGLLLLSFSTLVLLAYRQRWLNRSISSQASRLRTLVNGLDEGILGLSPEGKIQFANVAARKLLNIQAEGADEVLDDFVEENEGQLDLKRLAEVSVPAPKNSGELVMRSRDGQRLPVRYRIETLAEAADDLAFVFIFSDISYFKSSEALMREQNERLKKMNEQLEEYSFLASHDLREPLRVIISYAKILERRMAQGLSKEEQEALFFLTDAAHKMNRRIEDLEQMASISRSDLHIQAISLQTVVEGIRYELSSRLEAVKAQLEIGVLPPVLRADRKLFECALRAVLHNALESAVSGRPLQIKVFAETDEHWCRISVSDNGCGIPAGSHQRIFRPFYRLSDNTDGSGMGLSMCVRAMERHGGRVSVDSSEGEGSRFTLHFPQREAGMYE